MKNYYALLVVFTLSSVSVLAEVLTVDNNAGSVAQYTSLGAAIAAAAEDDTILVAGSASSYGNHDVYKTLHFVGAGFFLGANNIPGLSTHLSNANINFKQNNAIGDSSGSSITGMSGQLNSDPGANSIVVDKCYDSGTNWYFQGTVTITGVMHRNTLRMRATNSSIANSILWTLQMDSANTTSTNCVIRGSIQVVPTDSFTNCIFSITNPANMDSDATITYSMNIGASLLPGGNNNINGEVFSNIVTQSGGDQGIDRFWALKEGSKAIGVGLGGADLGPFGGPDPYVLGGVPGRPRITRFDVPPTATGLSALTFEVESEAFAE